MPITRSELQADIYEILNKSPTAYGLLTPTKVNRVIQDSMDYIAAKMLKIGGGWLTKVVYSNVTANSSFVALPTGLVILNFVKKLSSAGDSYDPMQFNENAGGSTVITPVSTSSFLPSYRFSSGQLYLEPQPSISVTNGIMFDGYFFPDQLTSDGSTVSGDLDNPCFTNYIKWRSAGILFSYGNNNTNAPSPFAQTELEWKEACLDIIARRFREPQPIIRFEDY